MHYSIGLHPQDRPAESRLGISLHSTCCFGGRRHSEHLGKLVGMETSLLDAYMVVLQATVARLHHHQASPTEYTAITGVNPTKRTPRRARNSRTSTRLSIEAK